MFLNILFFLVMASLTAWQYSSELIVTCNFCLPFHKSPLPLRNIMVRRNSWIFLLGHKGDCSKLSSTWEGKISILSSNSGFTSYLWLHSCQTFRTSFSAQYFFNTRWLGGINSESSVFRNPNCCLENMKNF